MTDLDFSWTAAERPGRSGPSQDRHRLVALAGNVSLALLADGAGGLAGGAEAAELAVARAEAWCRRNPPTDFAGLFDLVKALDRALVVDAEAGVTALALVLAGPDRVRALSVGNAEVWIHGLAAPTVLNGKRRYGSNLELGTGLAMADMADLPREGIRALVLWTDEAWSPASWDEVDVLLGAGPVEAGRLLPAPGHEDDATVVLGVAG